MHQPAAVERGWTRRRVLRTAATGGAVAAGGALIGARGGDPTSLASSSPSTDTDILNMFLLLERVQQDFYRAALERSGLGGDLLTYASAVSRQESDHVDFLQKRLGSRAQAPPQTAFPQALTSPARFRAAAVDLEEAVVAGLRRKGVLR